MPYKLGEPTVQQYFDASGDPLVGGRIEFYLWNTTTATPVYSDSIGTSVGTSVSLDLNGAPVNANGTPIALFFDTAVTYRIVRKDAADGVIGPTIGPYVPMPVEGTTAGTYAAGNDSRIVATDVSALDAGDRPDGTPFVPALQDGNPVKLTTQQIAGTMVDAAMTQARDTIGFFSHFDKCAASFTSSTTGTQFGQEPFTIWANGAAAAVTQSGGLFPGIAACVTGSTSTGYAAITASATPVLITGANGAFDFRAAPAVIAIPDGTQTYTIQVGLFTTPSAVATQGVFFRGTSASANWTAVVKTPPVKLQRPQVSPFLLFRFSRATR
jgi:hypothetical protein